MVKVKKDGFVVIGKEGSTSDGEGFREACIWREWNAWTMRRLLMDGPSGQYRVMSI